MALADASLDYVVSRGRYKLVSLKDLVGTDPLGIDCDEAYT